MRSWFGRDKIESQTKRHNMKASLALSRGSSLVQKVGEATGTCGVARDSGVERRRKRSNKDNKIPGNANIQKVQEGSWWKSLERSNLFSRRRTRRRWHQISQKVHWKKALKFYLTWQIGSSKDLSKGSFSGVVTTKGLVPRQPFYFLQCLHTSVNIKCHQVTSAFSWCRHSPPMGTVTWIRDYRTQYYPKWFYQKYSTFY